MAVTTADIARRVNYKLDQCGWIKGKLGTVTDGVCVNGAFKLVMIEDGLFSDDYVDMAKVPEVYTQFFWRLNTLAAATSGQPYLQSWQYNDLETTSLEDVKLLVRRAGE